MIRKSINLLMISEGGVAMEENRYEGKKEYEPVRIEFIPLEMNENIAISGYYETDEDGNEYFVNPSDKDYYKK